jgi:peptidoglycan/xylan/chitin deacetylase (PgdA/CDA1 family)
LTPRPRRILAGALTAAAAVHAAPAAAALSARARALLGIRGSTGAPAAVALTFDDGPHPSGTPAVLDALARAGARATFFLVGEQVEPRPALAAEIVAAGHEVGLHGHTHRGHLRLLPPEAGEDVRRGAAVVSEAADRPVRLHRPPFGCYSAASLAIVRRAGLEPVLWSRHGRDWSRHATPGSVADRLARGLSAGEILLLHDADHYGTPGSWRRTARALPLLLDRLADAGLAAVPA